MDQHRLEYRLKLIPINTQLQQQDLNQAADAWLENDDANLLHKIDNSTDKNHQTVTTIPSGRSFTLTHLDISQVPQGFSLQMKTGSVLLKNDDRLIFSGLWLQVQITKTEIVQNPDPNVDQNQSLTSTMGDNWQAALPTAQPSTSMISDPFATSILPNEIHQQDPLDFLYGGPGQGQQTMNDIIPNASGMGSLPYDPVPTLQSPMPSLPVAQQQNQPALDIDTQTVYSPSASVLQSQQSDEGRAVGNVLRDLGIDEQTSVLTQTPVRPQPQALKEQSPMDMLDEYLVELTPQAYGYGMAQNQQKTLLGSMKAFKKKLMG